MTEEVDEWRFNSECFSNPYSMRTLLYSMATTSLTISFLTRRIGRQLRLRSTSSRKGTAARSGGCKRPTAKKGIAAKKTGHESFALENLSKKECLGKKMKAATSSPRRRSPKHNHLGVPGARHSATP